MNGLDVLLAGGAPKLLGKRVGLLAHPASVDAFGVHASVRIRQAIGKRLVALFGPEHGFHGRGGAGESIGEARHPAWDIPIHSLYGAQRKPTAAMLKDIDLLIFDLQDLAVRCYTFVTTLRYVLEACAESGVDVLICDRPVPLPDTVEGPMLDPAFTSFVAGVPAPFVYGMTPGEAARWLKSALGLKVNLDVAALRGYRREYLRGNFSPWISPSPGIRSWETAWTYPALVGFEALPAVDFARGGLQPFQQITITGLDAEKLARHLTRQELPGTGFSPVWTPQPGVRIHVFDPRRFRPYATGLALIEAIRRQGGESLLWSAPGARPAFFDQLMGTDQVRLALQAGVPWRRIAEEAGPSGERSFRAARRATLLYAAA